MVGRAAFLGVFVTAILVAPPAHADCVTDFFARQTDNARSPVEAARAMVNDVAYKKCAARAEATPRAAPKPITGIGAAMARAPSRTAAAKPPDLPPAYITNIYPLLRRDFNDVWLFDKRKNVSDVKDAEGAEFSYAADRIAHNNVWNVHAMGAMVFQVLHDRYPKGSEVNFIGLSVAPFIAVNRVSNSNPKAQTNNVDQISFGGSGEIGFDMLGGAHYFRARGASVSDQIANTTSGSATLEWIPVYDGVLNSPFGFRGIPVSFMFGPEWKVRRDNVIVNDTTGVKDSLWRTGPQVIFRYSVVADALPDSIKALAFLKTLHGQTTYSWLTDTSSNRSFSYFNSSLTFNLDPDGHFGLSGSYTKGRLEDTGRQVDLWKAGVTGKF